MILAKFYEKNRQYSGFCVSGHAGYADAGEDIVCAGVSSALQMTVNGIVEILAVDAAVTVEENEISLSLPTDAPDSARAFLQAFRLHLELLSQDYQETIQLTDLEVS